MERRPQKINEFRKRDKKSVSTKSVLSVTKDSRLRLVIGFFVLAISLYLFIAFVSYLFTGNADQSIVNASGEMSPVASETRNWLGLYGAALSHYFIFEWLGISAFLIPPLLFLWGCRMLFGKSLLPLLPSFAAVVFFGLWVSLLMGYITYDLFGAEQVDFITGGMGYELGRIASALLGWGTLLLLALSLTVFAVYFFNITSLRRNKRPADTAEEVPREAPTPEGSEPKAEEEQKSREKMLSVDATEKNESQEPSTEQQPSPDPARNITLAVQADNPPLPDAKKAPAFEVKQPAKAESKGQKVTQHGDYDPTLDLSRFVFPPLTLLDAYREEAVQVSQDELTQNKDKIVATLTNFKIGITSIKATIGPTVTLYEIVPEAGIKISRIKSLEDDIALSLAAFGIRIIAPIPGKGTIGIEVPNKNREMVQIRQALQAKAFTESDKELPIALGKTIANETLVVDLTKMPHLLVAGATGQGKSVGLNVILTSLLYKRHPSQLKFVLVDPKKVEMSLFAKIERHYLAKLPNSEEAIITDIRKVVHTLNSLCIEMENRYEIMKVAGTRNIKEYNAKFVSRKLNPNEGHRFLPYIVLIIDELADLMMTAGKEVETPIARLAQLARAIGIHLVVATQRPSVNVITGIIKANFPARLSFRVTSKVDSRTILDAGGADQLIGYGDMLLSSGSDIVRLQCPFVSAQEVESICDFIGAQQGYESAYLLPEFEGEDDGGAAAVDLSDRDSFFEDAARLVVSHQQGSASLIQRKLKLGYNRAGRIIDQLEAAGIVGAFEGSKAREVLVHDEESLSQLLTNLREKYASL